MVAETLSRPRPLPPVAPSAARPRNRAQMLPYGWPVYLMFAGYPFFWMLGMEALLWPVMSLPMLSYLVRRRASFRVPRGFVIWALFIAWMLLSAVSLRGSQRILAFSYRGSLYLTATILLLYLFNLDRQRFSVRRFTLSVMVMWVSVIIFGFLAMTFPTTSWASPMEYLLPAHIVHNPFVYSMVHPSFAGISTLFGLTTNRPRAPFNYTNEWGSNLAILTPLAIYGISMLHRRIVRLSAIAVLILSLVPIIYSINRGLWISLSLAVAFVIVRLGVRGNVKLLTGSLALIAVAAAVVLFSPLQGVIVSRIEHPNNTKRADLYSQATDKAFASPIIGYGAPQPAPNDPTGPSVGTHGQLWTLVVSQGFPGIILYVGWFAFAFFAVWRVSSAGLWAQGALVAGMSQLPVYNQLPVQIHLLMAAIALCWWDVNDQRRRAVEASSAAAVADLPVQPRRAAATVG